MGRYTLHIDLNQPFSLVKVARSSANDTPSWSWREILVIFNREATRLSGPTQATTPEAIGQAGRLAKHYTREQLTDMVHLFWTLYSEDVYDGSYGHPIRAFAAKAEVLAREATRHVRL